jgi:hypothetical protein
MRKVTRFLISRVLIFIPSQFCFVCFPRNIVMDRFVCTTCHGGNSHSCINVNITFCLLFLRRLHFKIQTSKVI